MHRVLFKLYDNVQEIRKIKKNNYKIFEKKIKPIKMKNCVIVYIVKNKYTFALTSEEYDNLFKIGIELRYIKKAKGNGCIGELEPDMTASGKIGTITSTNLPLCDVITTQDQNITFKHKIINNVHLFEEMK